MPMIKNFVSKRSKKIQVLNEIVRVLKEHVRDREETINGLQNQIPISPNKIRNLEQELDDTLTENSKTPFSNNIEERQCNGEVPCYCLNFQTGKSYPSFIAKTKKLEIDCKEICDEFREKIEELAAMSRSSTSDLYKPDHENESLKQKRTSLRSSNGHFDQSILDLKTDNKLMKEKLERLQDISAENLLLQSDAADYQAELAELRKEGKQLRSKCYELDEDNRQCQAEIRDLRRYIELLKSNKDRDSRQDLLNKIEYYQMEHERLLDEIRRLHLRLGEISPRTSSHSSPQSNYVNGRRSEYLDQSPVHETRKNINVSRQNSSRERGRYPVSNALAASTASCLAANRLKKDRSLSPNAALQFRDLTMARYKQHMEDETDNSATSDSTEDLLVVHQKDSSSNKSHMNGNASCINSEAKQKFTRETDNNEKFSETIENGNYSEKIGCNSMNNETNRSTNNLRKCSSTTSDVRLENISPIKAPLNHTRPDSERGSNNCLLNHQKFLPKRAFAPRSPADLRIGHSIKFTRPGGKMSKGVVKYIGHLPKREEIFIGVELDDLDGKHSGTYQGTKYFSCPSDKGIFTPFSKIIMAWE